MIKKQKENKIEIIKRPPVVVVLGHIDHGKTSLLMAIKDFRVLGKESGGITQHVGAYQIEYNGQKITFIDTPGHESFSAIRSRGAKAADIGILVIDACEGIKKQTKEAIKHIKESGITPIIALNKIDKENANPEKVKQELLREDMWVESLGGKIPSVEISAKTKQGIDSLLEIILLVAEIENLETDINKEGEAVVIESRLDSKKGPTATAIITQGIIERGDYIATNSVTGKVKTFEDFNGKNVLKAFPGDPVNISGFSEVPSVGEIVKVYSSFEESNKNIRSKELLIKNPSIKEGDKVIHLVIKADVIGSLEGILEILKTIPQDKVKINILKAEVGDINEKDVKLAKNSEAPLISFRVKTDKIAESIIQNTKIDVYNFDIIYDLAKTIRELMDIILVAQKERIDVGEVDVLAIFRTEKEKQIVGGRVVFGQVEKGLKVEIFRNNEKIGEGKVMGLETSKKKVDVVYKDNEAGILYQGKVRIEEGDLLRFYKEEFVKYKV
ncbi:MAG: translation initiation factor IF-2 [Candidatus Pacebacteria bacterium]|nr:translation initiation factor IF-2 [Candidatus Paceibacterota bacterium]MDD4333950.1 translation initiation factor IF-2 [Candidatus Paceibacterota bacterium]